MWAIVCMISVGIHELGTTINIICIIIIVGNIERLRLAIIRGGLGDSHSLESLCLCEKRAVGFPDGGLLHSIFNATGWMRRVDKT